MPLIQGGPPEWIWERTGDLLRSEVVPVRSPEGHTVYEIRLSCGMEIVRLEFFTREELRDLAARIAELGELSGEDKNEVVRNPSGRAGI